MQKLGLSSNQLISLPTEIWYLSQLQELYLSNNKLNFLPIEIGQLSHLEVLNLSSNQLTTLPAEMIGSLTALRGLQLNENPLKSISDEIRQRFCLYFVCN
nr:leucine-rich repeat domain-containing protein [Neochlamydia sp. AcF84]